MLELIENTNEQLAAQYKNSVNTAVTSLLNQVTTFTTTDICDSNLKNAFTDYLKSIPVETGLDNSSWQQLKTIAEQCYSEGGIGVSAARALYTVLGRNDLSFNNCSPNRPRSSESTIGSVEEVIIFPNPTNGVINILLPEKYKNKEVVYQVSDLLGRTILNGKFVLGDSPARLDLSNHGKGSYFVNIQINGEKIKPASVIIK